ncbi:MAG: T9SS type A sorting domain-containing protein, partial [Bacteroidia bacterium]
ASAFNLTTAGTNPGRIDAADIDNDGKIDLVVPNSAAVNSFSVFRNISSPGSLTSSSFATRLDFSTGSGNNGQCAKIADLDGDGLKDVIIGLATNSFQVYRNTTTSSGISFASPVTFSAGTLVAMITIDDFDGDGKLDLATGNFSGNSVTVLRNTSTGTGSINFSSTVVTFSGASSGVVSGIASGDLDIDGKPDIVFSNYYNTSLYIYRNTCTTGTLSFTYIGSLTTSSYPNAIAFSDIDGDTKPDIICATYFGNNVNIFRNTSVVSIMSFSSAVSFSTGTGSAPLSVTAVDLNGDFKPDIATANSSDSCITVFKNTASVGTFTSSSLTSGVNFTTGSGPIHVVAKDFDLDGRIDFATANNTGGAISIFRNLIVAIPPATAGSTINFMNVNNNSMTVAFSKGDGARRIVLCKASSSVNSAPTSGTIYNPNSTFGSGSQIGTGNYVVYSDTGSSFSLTGLSPNTTYYFAVYEYNGINGFASFLTSSFLAGSQSTLNITYYYAKSTGYLNSLSTWGVNTDGTGTAPGSFSYANSYYFVRNNSSPTINGNLTITGGNTALIIGDGVNTYNLNIPGTYSITTDTLLLKKFSAITISGSISGINNYFEDSTTAQYLSTSAQNILTGSYWNLIAGSSVKMLNNGNVVARNSFTMMSSVNLNSYALMIGTSTTQLGTLNYVAGTIYGGILWRWFAQSTNTGSTGLFPIGTSANYRPVQINYTTAPSSGGALAASFVSTAPNQNGLPVYDTYTTPIIGVNKVGTNGTWVLTPSGLSGGQFTTTLTAAAFWGISSTNYADLRIMRRTNSSGAWTCTGTAVPATGSATNPVLSRTGMNLFGEFGVGGDSTSNALPVKLIILTVQETNHNAILTWQTASEINSDHFEIEKSLDLPTGQAGNSHWSFIGKLDAAGNSNETRNYLFKDDITTNNKQQTTNLYYRLKQIDKDGSVTNSNIVALDLKKLSNSVILFPLPLKNVLTVVSQNNEVVHQITIYDLSGKQLITGDSNELDVSGLAQGMYIAKIETDRQTYYQKITK